jgi:hypothetical protein
MTSNPGADHGPPPPDGGDTPPLQPEPYAPPGWANPLPPRPRTVSIASGLWIALGVIFVLGTISYLGSPQPAALTAGPIIPDLLLVMGGAFIVLGSRMRRGRRNNRTALTVLGAIALIGLWPVLLVVPAIVLQYRPDSTAWLRAVGTRRAGFR